MLTIVKSSNNIDSFCHAVNETERSVYLVMAWILIDWNMGTLRLVDISAI